MDEKEGDRRECVPVFKREAMEINQFGSPIFIPPPYPPSPTPEDRRKQQTSPELSYKTRHGSVERNESVM